ncbi:S-layer homology domain-containing protein [Gracilibacillus sp. YIM 98692]|uniref:S-layer homology domain-containing protein n=1 Tax=Gracilibacillus sp. YIM 98692 TaxID=2663532 RepID=UPI0013D54F7B|nr:S-layer homology domain-containing protein [Gracilibacillus sp. YIM 98692]
MKNILTTLKFAVFGLALTGALYIAPQIAQADGFSDVDTKDWAYEHIKKMEELDIINGYPDGTFRGDNFIRREHVAEMIDRALDLPIHQSYIPFEDVSNSNDYIDSIKAVQQAGIFTGDRGNFKPKANMTRAQMAKVIVEAFDLPIKKGHAFSDVADSNWAKDYISTIAYYRISTGSNGDYMPDNDVTRRHFAAFLDRALETKGNDSGELNEYEQQVIALTNQEREKHGLPALKTDTELSKVSREKSRDMAENNYFSHQSPTYGSPFDMLKQFGINYRTAGENIAKGQRTPEEVVNAWMNSQGHRANILNENFTHIGVGFVDQGNYWTQQFIGK